MNNDYIKLNDHNHNSIWKEETNQKHSPLAVTAPPSYYKPLKPSDFAKKILSLNYQKKDLENSKSTQSHHFKPKCEKDQNTSNISKLIVSEKENTLNKENLKEVRESWDWDSEEESENGDKKNNDQTNNELTLSGMMIGDPFESENNLNSSWDSDLSIESNNSEVQMTEQIKGQKFIKKMRVLGGLDQSFKEADNQTAALGLSLLAGSRIEENRKYALQSLVEMLNRDTLDKSGTKPNTGKVMKLISFVYPEFIVKRGVEIQDKRTEISEHHDVDSIISNPTMAPSTTEENETISQENIQKNQNNKLAKCVEEMLTTEETFGIQMAVATEVLAVIKKSEHSKSIDTIAESYAFLRDLSRIISSELKEAGTDLEKVKQLLNLPMFKKYFEELKKVTIYYSELTKTLNKHSNNKEIINMIKLGTNGKITKLNALFLTGVQRGPRYILLLKEVEKAAPKKDLKLTIDWIQEEMDNIDKNTKVANKQTIGPRKKVPVKKLRRTVSRLSNKRPGLIKKIRNAANKYWNKG